MLDIETLRLSPNSVIASIGAARFYPTKPPRPNEVFERRIDLVDAASRGLKLEPNTVEWWFVQSKDAQEAILGGKRDRLDVALRAFSLWVANLRAPGAYGIRSPLAVWAKSPNFDYVLLEAAYSLCNLLVPWSYREMYDVRTLLAVAPLHPDWAPATPTVKYSALAAAVAQASDVIDALAAIGATKASTVAHKPLWSFP